MDPTKGTPWACPVSSSMGLWDSGSTKQLSACPRSVVVPVKRGSGSLLGFRPPTVAAGERREGRELGGGGCGIRPCGGCGASSPLDVVEEPTCWDDEAVLRQCWIVCKPAPCRGEYQLCGLPARRRLNLWSRWGSKADRTESRGRCRQMSMRV